MLSLLCSPSVMFAVAGVANAMGAKVAVAKIPTSKMVPEDVRNFLNIASTMGAKPLKTMTFNRNEQLVN